MKVVTRPITYSSSHGVIFGTAQCSKSPYARYALESLVEPLVAKAGRRKEDTSGRSQCCGEQHGVILTMSRSCVREASCLGILNLAGGARTPIAESMTGKARSVGAMPCRA